MSIFNHDLCCSHNAQPFTGPDTVLVTTRNLPYTYTYTTPTSKELHGNTDSPLHSEYLDRLENEFRNLDFFNKPEDVTCIPERRLLYLEQFSLSYNGLSFREFWESTRYQEGVAESVYCDFGDAPYVRGCVSPDAPVPCTSYFSWLFKGVCHYSDVSEVWHLRESTNIARKVICQGVM